MKLWPHQTQAIEMTREAIRQGYKFPCVVSTTGSGKSLVIEHIARLCIAKGKSVVVFTNRRVLLSQLSDQLKKAGVQHGVMASGEHYSPIVASEPLKIISLQTFDAWCLSSDKHDVPPADIAIIDEVHSNVAATAQEIYKLYPLKIGFTATPVGLGGICDKLLIASNYSQLFAQEPPPVVRCDVYAPTEIDMEGLKQTDGEWSQTAMRKRFAESKIIGDVWEHWARINPWKKPTLVFAPGVKESQQLVEEVFVANGVDAAHVDGETSEHNRRQIFDSFNKGNLTVISSCGVLREGANFPCAEYGILLQPCGRLSAYIQIVGRLLRSHPGKSKATLIDHAGAWHRHGPPDMDRDWQLDDSDVAIAKERKKNLETGKEKEGICCPECGHVRPYGPKCPMCGHIHERSVRHVRTKEGTLVKVTGPTVKPVKPRGPIDDWKSMIFRAARSSMTLAQMRGLFYHETGLWPESLGMKEYLLPSGTAARTMKASELYPWAARKGSQ